jgi:hypothetical protein
MKFILLVYFLLLGPSFAFSQSEEIQAVTKTVQLYFDGMMERDPEKLERAFFKEARLIGYRGSKLVVTPFEEWVSNTAKGIPRDPALFKNELKSIRIMGNTALAETELFWPDIYYYDFLTLIMIDGRWKIVHKSWHEKSLDKEGL